MRSLICAIYLSWCHSNLTWNQTHKEQIWKNKIHNTYLEILNYCCEATILLSTRICYSHRRQYDATQTIGSQMVFPNQVNQFKWQQISSATIILLYLIYFCDSFVHNCRVPCVICSLHSKIAKGNTPSKWSLNIGNLIFISNVNVTYL